MNNWNKVLSTLAIAWCAQASAVDFSIMGDVTYQDGSPKEEKGGFALGQIDLFATHDISEDTKAFMEVVFEDDDGYVLDVERLWVEKHVRDELNVAAGRFHTTLGHYNATYHHGTLIQFTIERPFFLDFEDGELAVLPTHIVGLQLSGNREAGRLELEYQASAGNGSSIDTDDLADDREIDMNNSGDDNSSKATVVRIGARDPLLGIAGGISHMNNKIAESGDLLTYGVENGGTLVDQSISAIDFRYENERVNFSAEFFHISNESVMPGLESDEDATAWFAAISTPITKKDAIGFRHEVLDVDSQDSYFSGINPVLPRKSADQNVVTYRHDFDDSNAVKLEWRQFDAENEAADDYVAAQWSFLMP